MPRIKGAAVRARLNYLADKYGAAEQQRVIAALDPAHRAAIEDGILISGWYPLELSDAVLGAAERLLGKADGTICQAIGRASARKGLTSTYSVFAANLSADEIAGKMERTTSLVWRSYYDEGDFHTRAAGQSTIQSELQGLKLQAPWLCHVLVGYITGHVEVLGGQRVAVVHSSCMYENKQRCLWDACWE